MARRFFPFLNHPLTIRSHLAKKQTCGTLNLQQSLAVVKREKTEGRLIRRRTRPGTNCAGIRPCLWLRFPVVTLRESSSGPDHIESPDQNRKPDQRNLNCCARQNNRWVVCKDNRSFPLLKSALCNNQGNTEKAGDWLGPMAD